MIILFRKTSGFHRYHAVYEWQPEASKNGRWYMVNQRNIDTGPSSLEQNPYIRQFFNAALAGLTCRVHAKYRRETKTLELEVMK